MRCRAGMMRRKKAKRRRLALWSLLASVACLGIAWMMSSVAFEPHDALRVSGGAAGNDDGEAYSSKRIAIEPWDALEVSGVAVRNRKDEDGGMYAGIEPFDIVEMSGVRSGNVSQQDEHRMGRCAAPPLHIAYRNGTGLSEREHFLPHPRSAGYRPQGLQRWAPPITWLRWA